MSSDTHTHRRADRGYVVAGRSALRTLRRALGLVPVTESLSALGQWRRSAPSAVRHPGNG
jgi:hypothetical protein